MREIKGVLVPNITFFNEDNTINYDLCRWHMNWMFDHGVDGLFVTGSYGAGPLMSNEERAALFELACDVSKKRERTYVIAHIGCADTASSVLLAKEAEKAGCDAVGAVPPFYYAYTEDRVIEYYKAIAESVKIPLYAYNNPTTTRVSMNFDTVQKLQAVGVKGIKDSTMNVNFLTRVFYDAKINNKDFKTIIGTSNGWLPFCLMGIDTMIAGMCNYAPEIVSKLYKLTLNGEIERAEKVYDQMMRYLAKCRFADKKCRR